MLARFELMLGTPKRCRTNFFFQLCYGKGPLKRGLPLPDIGGHVFPLPEGVFRNDARRTPSRRRQSGFPGPRHVRALTDAI